MRLIRGAPGTGKTSLIFREFKQALRNGRRDMRIVVPTATLVRHFQHELARDGAVFPPGAVLSLSRFAQELAPQCRLVPDGLLRAIAREVLLRLKPAEFAEVCGTEGMTATILDTIALFENAGCTADKFNAIRKLSPQAKAFGKVWIAVAQRVAAAGFHTRAQILAIAAANSVKIPVWMDGFINFSAAERTLVSAVVEHCDLTLTLTNSPAADDLRRFAMQLGAEDRLLPGHARKPVTAAVAATSMPREADEIARRILDLHREGVQFREIGVALRDMASYVPLLQGTFERFGIPARFYFSTPLRRHQAAIFLGGLIDCVQKGWEFGAALETLRAHPGWGNSSAFDRFDFKVREAMPGTGGAELLSHAEEDFAKRISPCMSLDAWLTQLATPASWALHFEQMAERLYRPGMLDPATDHQTLDAARSHSAALGAWTHAVSDSVAFWPDAEQAITLEAFWQVAREAVEAASLHVADERRDVVHVMNVQEARQWDVAALFVCGMTDREFPRRHPQNLLFPDADIEALRKNGLPLLRKGSDQDRDEEVLWEALRTRAQDSLILTCADRDIGGRSAQRSRFLDAFEFSNAKACQSTPPITTETVGLAGRIDSKDLQTALGEVHQRIGLTSLEDLLQCRFKFFAGRSLGLKPRPERPQERLQPKTLGLIMHGALEAWLNQNRQGDFVDLFEEAFLKMVNEKHLPPGYRLEVERINYRAIARKVNATEQWTPVSSQAEVELTMDFPGGIKVNCRVDRIDRMSDTDCIILDYKGGKTARVEQMVESQVKLQGPLYALAVREQLQLNTIAMMYLAVRDDKRFGWGEVPGTDLGLKPIPPNWIEDAKERAVERLSSFLSGAVQADPAEPENCQWCDFQHACHVEEREALVMIASVSNDQGPVTNKHYR
jgi:ATP-dependent helicase/DNAse subunit B